MKVYIVFDEFTGSVDSVHTTKEDAVARAKALLPTLQKNNGAYIEDVQYLYPGPVDKWVFCVRVTWEGRTDDEAGDDIYVEEWEVDVPEVVRCKDCKYWDRTTSVDGECFCDRLDERRLDDGSFDYFTKENWYCAEGEKEDE